MGASTINSLLFSYRIFYEGSFMSNFYLGKLNE